MLYGFRKISRDSNIYIFLFCNFYWINRFARQGIFHAPHSIIPEVSPLVSTSYSLCSEFLAHYLPVFHLHCLPLC